MHDEGPSTSRLRRLGEELAEAGFDPRGTPAWRNLLLVEIDAALRPHVFERRVASYGSVIDPTTDPSGWRAGTDLVINLRPVDGMPLAEARLFADGLSSWLIRRSDDGDEWAIFDRPSGSERDLVVLAEVLGATLVQRHPSGVVRVAGTFGVLRWDGLSWHHEPPLAAWIDSMAACSTGGDRDLLETYLEFAVHDLGARGIGAILIARDGEDDADQAGLQHRLPLPPPLNIRCPWDLAPLRHALAQVDGAAVFDASGTLRQLGVRLVPTPEAEVEVDSYRGMRHTSASRYSYDDPEATVIVVSEDGPVTVMRKGMILGRSPRPSPGWPAPDGSDDSTP
jgi:hypothetical protein